MRIHPDKFLKRAALLQKPQMSEAMRAEQLATLSHELAGKRKEAIDARVASGIEIVWNNAEDAYLGIDDANRGEFTGAAWAKPNSSTGPLQRESVNPDPSRSTAYPRLTSRYVDTGAAKLSEILLPIDDKAFSFEPTPDPDMVKQLDNMSPQTHPLTGMPVMKVPEPNPLQNAAASAQSAAASATSASNAAGQPTGHQGGGVPPTAPAMQTTGPAPTGTPGGAAAPVPATASDLAQAVLDHAEECAKAAEERIYDWMIECNYPAEVRKVVHDSARIGSGVLKGPFPEAKKNRAVVKTGDEVAIEMQQKISPVVRWIDPWNFFPADGCGEDIHDGDYTFERDFLSAKKLRKLKDQKGYLNAQIDQVLEEGPGKVYVDSRAPEKLTRKRFEIWYFYGTMKRDMLKIAQTPGLDSVPKDKEDIDVIVSMINDTIIRAVINPLDSGAFPYHVMTWSRRPGSWAGVGIAEQIMMPQRMVTAATRALLNNAALTAGPQIIFDQLGIVPADGSSVLTPNKVWYMTGDAQDATKAFAVVEISSAAQQMMGIIEYGMKTAEESCGIPLITQGQTGPTSPDTFGQAELQDNNAHTWLRSVGYRFDDMITEPVVHKFYEYLLLDPEVPNEEKGDFNINAHGSIAMVERAIQEQTLLGMLKVTENPSFKVDPAKLFGLLCKAKRINPEDVQYTKAEQEKMDSTPPNPPLPIAVEQLKGQNAIQAIQAKGQLELQQSAQEMQQEQQLLQNGGASPHKANSMAKIEAVKVKVQADQNIEASRAQTEQVVEQSRAAAETARAQKEQDIAYQNGQFRLQELQLEKEIALLKYSSDQKISLDDSKTQLARSAMDNQTKQSLASAEIELAQSEGAHNRAPELHKHDTSLVRDEMSTPDTP